MECSECDNLSCPLCGSDTAWLQRCFFCRYAESLDSGACKLCFSNDCGFIERADKYEM